MTKKRIEFDWPILAGSISTANSRCGAEGCGCQKKRSPQLHGTYYRWTGFIDGKRTTKTISKEVPRECKSRIRLYIEVNTGGEEQKAGVLPEAADAFIREGREQYGLPIEGLMCIPPFDEPPAPHFALLQKIARRNALSGLSMGMSADFQSAIAFGATHVRVGSAIFGARD